MALMDRPETTDYDGCGKCLVGVRRLSRKTETTNSPEKQGNQVLKATAEVGGHIIGWADDWEVSGATDPLTRPELGPWLRGEMGPYDGIVGAAVDRIGRNVRDVLNTAYAIHGAGQLLVTADHPGIWNLDDPSQESELLLKGLGAQLEHRAIRKRVQDEHVRARAAGQPKNKLSYGYMYVRHIPTGKVDEVALHPEASKEIRNVAERILADVTGQITISTECSRLTREGVPTPHDLMAVMYGRDPKGSPWTYQTLRGILWSEASLGYLMHKGKPVLGPDGRPRKIAPPLWDRATRDALIEKTRPKREKRKGAEYGRAAQGTKLLVGIARCGNCGERLVMGGLNRYICTARVRGIPGSQACKPAPSMRIHKLESAVEDWFLTEYGRGQVMKKEFDPGTGYAAQIADLEADRKRLREDRRAGLYDADDDAEWFRTEYARMGDEITELKKFPERPAGVRMIPTGRTVADDWRSAKDDAARRELLNEFEVKVTLFSSRVDERIKIEGVNAYEIVR
ncbi:recombinase family protein [Streptomyces sp. NBC_01530]|uniref:recombinase family protein n=1 Tax=Streptomyces sp. NBC_01530 TaxID=2903895 RepID=UPI003863DFED